MNTENNVVALFTPSTAVDASVGSKLAIMDQLADAGMFYQVERRPNLTVDNAGNIVETGESTIFNTNANLPIGIMSTGYRIIQNREVFDTFSRAIARSGLDMEGMYIDTKGSTFDGSKAVVNFVFPNHEIDIAKKGDIVRFSIRVVHSFDGSAAFVTSAQGLRLACLNGMVIPSQIISYTQRHSWKLDLNVAAQSIVTSFEAFLKNAEHWEVMSSTPVSDKQVYRALAELSGFKDFFHVQTYDQYLTKVKKNRITLLEKYMGVYADYRKTLGDTEWALYNTLTHISTHGMKDRDPSIVYRYQTETKVAGIMEKYKLVA